MSALRSPARNRRYTNRKSRGMQHHAAGGTWRQIYSAWTAGQPVAVL